MLHALGYSCTYCEVLKFKRCAAAAAGTNLDGLTEKSSVLFAADNIDRNVCTIDGSNTIHAMGMIATLTPANKAHTTIPRDNFLGPNIEKIAAVSICQYRDVIMPSESAVTFDKLLPSSVPLNNLELLWQISRTLKPDRPS